MNWLKQLSRATGIFLLTLLCLIRCGGAGNSAPQVGAEVSEKVRVIPSDGSVVLEERDEDALTLSGAVPDIKPGHVIVSDLDLGFLRKARTVTRSRDGEVTIETDPATFEDLYTNAQISVIRTLGYDELDDRSRTSGEVAVSPGGRSGGSIHLDISERTIATAGGVSVKLSGSVDLSFDLDFQIRVEAFHLQSGRVALTARGDSELKVKGGFNGIDIKVPITSLAFKPINIAAGKVLFQQVTIPIRPKVDLSVVIRGDMAAEFVATASASAAITGGTEYSGGDWHTIKDFSRSFDLSIEKNFNAGSYVNFCPLFTETSIDVFDDGHAYFRFEPNFLCTYSRQSNPAGLQVSVDGNFLASAGAHASKWGINLVDRDFPNFMNASFHVFDRFFADPPGGGGGGGGGEGEHFHYNVWRDGGDAFNRDQAWAAQSFVAKYNKISWLSFNGGDTGGGHANSATVFIYSTLAMTNPIAAKLVTISAYGETVCTFDNPVAVSPGTRYWVQIHTGQAGKPVQLYASKFGNDYPDGVAYYHDFGGSTITDSNSDLNLKIHE